MKWVSFIFTILFFWPGVASALLVDDFQDGDKVNGLYGMWEQYTDGKSTIAFQCDAVPGFGAAKYCLHIQGELDKLSVPYPYAGVLTFLNRNCQMIDLSMYQGIRFYGKGQGKCRISISTSATKDYTIGGHYGQVFSLSGNWRPYELKFSDFTQSWGVPKPWAPSQSFSVNFETNSDLMDMYLAKVEFFPDSTQAASVKQGGYAVPNPFSPTRGQRAFFDFTLGNNNSSFRIMIFNVRGRLQRKLYNVREWDGRSEAGHLCEGGVYVYQIEAEGKRLNGKIVLVK